MYKLSFFIPQDGLEAVKSALFKVGAGRIGNYDQCCWQVKGQGQFRPLAGSAPAIGDQDALIKAAVNALKEAHPYEEVAYEVMQLVDV
jgi:hypothetical protein